MANIRLLYLFINLILLTLNSCTQIRKERCYLFNNKYPETLSKMGGEPDTTILIRVLNDIIEQDNRCIDACLTRGDLYFNANNNAKAKEDYRKVSLLDTGNIYALYKMGLVFQDEDLYDSSIYFLQLAINKKKRGGFLVDYNQVTKELSTNENRYDVESLELYYRQAVSYYYKNDLKLALSCFNFCIQNKYRLDKSFLYRGAIYLAANKEVEACRDFLDSKKQGNIDAENYLQKYCPSK